MEFADGGNVEGGTSLYLHTCDYIVYHKDMKYYSELLDKLNEELDERDGRGLE